MANKAGGDANTKDDPKDKPNNAPADDSTGKGGKAEAGDQGGDDDTTGKKYTQADLDAALAGDRQARRRSQTKSEMSPAKKKSKGDDDDDDGERETLRKRAEGAEEKLRQQDARDDLEDEAARAGFKNPRKMYRLLKDDLTFDSSGKPDNIKDLITIAKRDFPEELDDKTPKGSADAGAKGAAGVKSSMNDFLRRGAGLS